MFSSLRHGRPSRSRRYKSSIWQGFSDAKAIEAMVYYSHRLKQGSTAGQVADKIDSNMIFFLYFSVSFYNCAWNPGTKASNFPVIIKMKKRNKSSIHAGFHGLNRQGTVKTVPCLFTIFFIVLIIRFIFAVF